MYIELLTEEIEDWLEKAEDEENLRFLTWSMPEKSDNVIILELLGYYGTIAQTVTKKIASSGQEHQKIAGIFSRYFNEMIHFQSKNILLPVSLVKTKIGNQDYILTTSSFAIPDVISYQLSEELLTFYETLSPSKIVIIDGVHSYQRNINIAPEVHRINSLKSNIDLLGNKNSNFTMMGQSASSFLTYYSNNANIPVELVVVESFPEYDPISSYKLLNELQGDFELDSDFSDLLKEIEIFKRKFSDKSEPTKGVIQYTLYKR
ncbi:MAG: PAC2 family protein [Candidatus Hodarchaeales archaeon]|jgi:predicted ATP-grasp superfamily ATP-dependent carboligase